MRKETITILSGPLKDQEFELDPSLTIGRDSENDIVLKEPEVSRKHASVEYTSGGTVLRDEGSGNGTYAGDRRVREHRLSAGEVFRVGSVELRYDGEPVDHLSGFDDSIGGRVTFVDSAIETVESSSPKDVVQTMFAAPSAVAGAEELQVVRERLKALYEANEIISRESDLERLFVRVLEQVFKLVPANNGVILLKNETTHRLEPRFEKSRTEAESIQVSKSIVQRAYDNGQAVLVHDPLEEFKDSDSIFSSKITSAICVPLLYHDEKLGAIYIDMRDTTHTFSKSDLELIVAVSGPAAVAIRNAQYVEQLEHDFQNTLMLLANAIELRDHYTIGHTYRVTKFSVALAEELGWDEERLKEVEMGGLLHDVGKIGVPDAVLSKPGRLTKEEYEMMKIHPERGAHLMRDTKRLQPLIPYCHYHHERYDGKGGYPHNLAGEDIPIEGRVVAVADAFDAMTSNRPYREGMDPERAIEEIEKCKGSQFDPKCADAFIRAYRAGKINYVLQDYHRDEKSFACPFCSTFVAIPEDAELGDRFVCVVCHRTSRLDKLNANYVGKLLSEAELETDPGETSV